MSIHGWERAIDAQLRIVREVERVLARDQSGDVLFVGHGAVGTLLFCHYSNFAINRAYDQPAAAVIISHSSRTDDAYCIRGVRWNIRLASESAGLHDEIGVLPIEPAGEGAVCRPACMADDAWRRN